MLRVGTTRSSVMLLGLCEARFSSAAAPFQPLPPGALVGPARLEGEKGPLLPVCSAWSPEHHPGNGDIWLQAPVSLRSQNLPLCLSEVPHQLGSASSPEIRVASPWDPSSRLLESHNPNLSSWFPVHGGGVAASCGLPVSAFCRFYLAIPI